MTYIGQIACEHCKGTGKVAVTGAMRSCAAVGSYVEVSCDECSGWGEHGVWVDEEVAADPVATPIVTAIFVVEA